MNVDKREWVHVKLSLCQHILSVNSNTGSKRPDFNRCMEVLEVAVTNADGTCYLPISVARAIVTEGLLDDCVQEVVDEFECSLADSEQLRRS